MEKLYTIEQLAEALQLNKQTVLRFIREGKIKGIKVGRSYRVKESEYNTYINGSQSTLSTEKFDGQN